MSLILKSAMRRAGANPTDVEITDIINRADNDTGYLDFSVRVRWLSIGDSITFSGILHGYDREESGKVNPVYGVSTPEKWK